MTSLVSIDWLAEHADDPNVCLIEINWDGTAAYDDGHIPGALGWNWKSALWDPFERQFPAQDEFAMRLGAAGITAETIVVFYGVPVQFGTYAWWVLRYCGHADVRMLNGGKVLWEAEGRAVTRDLPQKSPTTYLAGERNASIRAGRRDVLQALADPGVTILDHRSYEEYSGQRVGLPGKPDVGAERSGRVPGAAHIPFDSLLNGDETFKSREEIENLVLPHLSGRDDLVISYCRLAHRATLASFAMTEILGLTNVRVYDGSWTEWGSLVGVPIER